MPTGQLVSVVVVAGALASVEVEVEALGRGPQGWLVILGYDHWMVPILTLVADRNVLEEAA